MKGICGEGKEQKARRPKQFGIISVKTDLVLKLRAESL